MSETDFQRLMIEQFQRQTKVLDKMLEFMGDSKRDRQNLHDKLDEHYDLIDKVDQRLTKLEGAKIEISKEEEAKKKAYAQ